MLGMDFSDSYMNEWGVTVSSNQCQSKEENGELVNGGIGYFLRRIMVERARTAREAVKIAGNLIENFGYASSGRSYCIAGPNEVWVLAAVKGKHWIAQRVPDNHVAIIPNYYTIGRVNLKDTINFLGSSDIIKYAVEKGWYQPETKKEFNFKIAYSKPSKLYSMINITRHWRALNLLSEKEYNINQKLPFSFNPKEKISLQDLMFVLQDHYEGTQLEMNPAYDAGNPHENVILRICSENNKYGFIAQIRNWLPKEMRSILWTAPRRPCIQSFVPWYCGITEIPEIYTLGDFRKALRNHFNPPHEIRKQTSSHAFWVFVSYADKIDENYGNLINKVKDSKNQFQKTIFNKQRLLEDTVLSIYKKDKQEARKKLTEFTAKMAKEAISLIK
jgi:dipeptidase